MIRKIEHKDRDAFLFLSEMFYSSSAVLHPVPRQNHEDTFTELMRSNEYAEAWIIEAEGNAVGYGLVAKTYSREAGGMVLWIEELFLLENYRSLGFGKEFFAMAERYAFKHGFARIRLEVEPENTRAMALYERLGFKPLDYRQMYKNRDPLNTSGEAPCIY